VNRSRSASIFDSLRAPNRAYWWVTCGALSFLAMVLYVPYLRDVFRFAAPPFGDLAVCLSAGVFSVVCFEIVKYARGRQSHSGPNHNNRGSSHNLRL
ncbi:MAG: cation transporting P-type ATPase, partial [Deltaproteobacteria bacterium]|nr:cation transporting P-type ATPase [Deltaproteobacteria bacterium]